MTPPPTPWRQALPRIALRLAVIVACVLVAHWLIGAAMKLTDSLPETAQGPARAGLLVVALLIYAVLIAIPFVPGIEIGISLLMLRGAEVAPAVYIATVAGLMLAFCLGRFVPEAGFRQACLDLRLMPVVRLLERIMPLSPPERLAALAALLPRWLNAVIGVRYLILAVLINLPGNSIIGGGGGIGLMAGFSRLFSFWPTIATIALAVAPVPFLVWHWGGSGLTMF